MAISNPGKLLYPDAGITKLQLARYYEAVGDWIVPHLKNRPLTLVRCPDGWNKQCFYQKNAPDKMHRAIKPVIVPTSEGESVYMMANGTEAVVALLQSGALEFHPWGSTARKLGHPDRITFDFDPDEGLGYRELVEAAKLVRDLLDNLGLRSFLKTTGGKGLHVVVADPADARLGHGQGLHARHRREPRLHVPRALHRDASRRPSARAGSSSTTCATPRARPPWPPTRSARAPTRPWPLPSPGRSSPRTCASTTSTCAPFRRALKRLKNDPWAEFFSVKQRVTASMLQSVGTKK